MACKDCMHYKTCRIAYRNGDDRVLQNSPCANFKNKSNFVEVVRCKDCNHWNCVSKITEHMGCDIFCDLYGREYPTNPEDFCSYGERRTDNDTL